MLETIDACLSDPADFVGPLEHLDAFVQPPFVCLLESRRHELCGTELAGPVTDIDRQNAGPIDSRHAPRRHGPRHDFRGSVLDHDRCSTGGHDRSAADGDARWGDRP
jgi:hypothetical protein